MLSTILTLSRGLQHPWLVDILPGLSGNRAFGTVRDLSGAQSNLAGVQPQGSDRGELVPVLAERQAAHHAAREHRAGASADGEALEGGTDGYAAHVPESARGGRAGATVSPDMAKAGSATMTVSGDAPIVTYQLGQPSVPGEWYVSTWAAGQSTITDWSPDNVRHAADGAVELILDRAEPTRAEPYEGGEIQSNVTASTGTWSWTAQAPDMVDGAVFGMFVYRADWQNQPWLEFDFEFVGADTTRIELAVHMGTADGRRVSNIESTVVELGFDAALASHRYEIVVTGQEAIFRVDGFVVGSFDSSDLPGGVWNTGPVRGYADLWAADPRYEIWTGPWVDPGRPLVARLEGAELNAGQIDPVQFIRGTDSDDRREGTQLVDRIDGQGGNDVLLGSGGSDTVQGGLGDDDLSGGSGWDLLRGDEGRDRLRLDSGNDRLEGGDGGDWVVADGIRAMTVDLSLTGAQATGSGNDTLLSIENALGGAGADRLLGSTGSNELEGGAGNDVLRGRAGKDVLIGGAGHDDMGGGLDRDRDVFVFRSVADSVVGSARDLVRDFVVGIDLIDLAAIDARPDVAGDQAFAYSGSQAAAWSVWAVSNSSGILLRADGTGDRVADFEVLLASTGTFSAGSVLL